MQPPRRWPPIAAAAAVALLVAGCGSSGSATGAGSPTVQASGGTGPGSSTAPAPSATATSGTTGTGATPGPIVAPSATSTADRTGEPPGAVIQLVSVTARADGANEQVVIAADGALTGWSLRYVDAVVIDGEPFIVAGDAALELDLQVANPNGDQGFLDAVADPVSPGLPLVQEVALAEYLGTKVTFAIGLSREAPYSVAVSPTGLTITFAG